MVRSMPNWHQCLTRGGEFEIIGLRVGGLGHRETKKLGVLLKEFVISHLFDRWSEKLDGPRTAQNQ